MQWTFCFITVLFLFACSNNQVTYQKGFPEVSSPGLTDFMTDYFMQRSRLLFNTDEYVFVEKNNPLEDEKIHYFATTKNEMEDFYMPIQEDDEPARTMKALYEKVDDLKQPVQNSLSLPTISCLENNMISVVYPENEKIFSLTELEKSIVESDELICNVTRMNSEGFIMQIDRQSTNDSFYLFALHDLSEVNLFNNDDLEQAVAEEKLVPFYSFLKNEPSDQYGSLLYNSFVDTKNHTFIQIEDEHITNQQYIYVNGGKDPLEKGPQYIQSIEHYLDGNDEMYAQFDINYKKIGKQLDFKATNDVSAGKVIYFSEDFIVLFINYNAPITGTSGSTNVLIDLQDKENPIFHVVDLDLF